MECCLKECFIRIILLKQEKFTQHESNPTAAIKNNYKLNLCRTQFNNINCTLAQTSNYRLTERMKEHDNQS